MDLPVDGMIHACTLPELQEQGRIVVRGGACPILLLEDRGRVFALDNRCPHLGFPLHRGSVEDAVMD
jgi:nitrite reductase/ring-hydroxylating ferredoxin subunit